MGPTQAGAPSPGPCGQPKGQQPRPFLRAPGDPLPPRSLRDPVKAGRALTQAMHGRGWVSAGLVLAGLWVGTRAHPTKGPGA